MLAIDVGNTNITVGAFTGDVLKDTVRVPTDACIASHAFLPHLDGALLENHEVALIASVRDDATTIVRRDLEKKGMRIIQVDRDTPMGIEIAYKSPKTLGVDRLVCAAAAYDLYGKRSSPVVVVDMGTATTIDYVSEGGVFMGGMIAPGMKSAYRGLLAAAPGLPDIELAGDNPVMGQDTASCLRAGAVTAHAAMVMKVVEMMGNEMAKSPYIVVTGGLSHLVRDIMPQYYIFDDYLILRGLFLIHSIIEGQGYKVRQPFSPIHV